MTPREITVILNQITKDDIIESGNKISLAGGEGEQYISKNLALIKARENINDDDDFDVEQLLVEKGLAKPCLT